VVKIIALDLSPRCTGVAIGASSYDGDVARVELSYVVSDRVRRSEPESAWVYRLNIMADRIAHKAVSAGCTDAYIEAYAWSMRGAHRIGEHGFAVKSALVKAGLTIHLVPMNVARKTLTGSGKSDKAAKMRCYEALKSHGFKPANLDESDALVVFNEAVGQLGGYCLVG